jgi:formate dehydrogenase subunit gamma
MCESTAEAVMVELLRMPLRTLAGVLALALLIGLGTLAPEAHAQEEGQVPGGTLGGSSSSDFWRAIREGQEFRTAVTGPESGFLIQADGEAWQLFRNRELATWGAWGLLGMVALLALFFALRGRIRIEAGRSGLTVERFNALERFTHWLTATCFVVLAITGLVLLYGRSLLIPLIGRDAFAVIALGGKYLHNYLAFGFMVGLVLMLVLWIRHNLPNRHDLVWLAKGGGMFGRGHAPARKFNAGQKFLFWLVILGGVSVSTSGLMLLFPFQIDAFGPTFAWINWALGTSLPTQLSALQEMQLAQLWHAIMGLFLTVIIIGHIYIGTIGMEGAFDAMGSGRVDTNWARAHHDKWVEELERKGVLPPAPAPAHDDAWVEGLDRERPMPASGDD